MMEQGKIPEQSFRKAYGEWRSCMFEQRDHYQQIHDIVCPSCEISGGSYHIDANMKLYTWDRDYESWRTSPYYEQNLFWDDAVVQSHIKGLDLAFSVKQVKAISRTTNLEGVVFLVVPKVKFDFHSCTCRGKTSIVVVVFGRVLKIPSPSLTSVKSQAVYLVCA
jgi:hypothetical protein